MKSQSITYFPLKISLFFLICTELLFWIGPTNYKINNDLLLAFYLAILNISLWYGYKLGTLTFKPSYYRFSKRTIYIIIILGLIANVRFLNQSLNNYGLSFSIGTIINSISNPGEAYFGNEGNASGTFLDIIIFSIFRTATIPLGICTWSRLNRIMKYCLLLVITLQIITYLCIGVRKGLFDIILYTFFLIIATKPYILSSPKILNKLKAYIAVLLVLFIFYFVFSIASRYGKTLQEIQDIQTAEIREPYTHLPLIVTKSLQTITSYLCQGYYALSNALEMGIKDVVFFSDNWVSAYYCEKIFNYNPIDLTYLADLESIGIDRKINWHTMYLWLANQYTFIGVPFVIFFIGYFFAQSWCDSVFGRNDYSYIILSYFIVMVFYMYANNQVFSDSATSFVFWFILYQISRYKLR